jgi:regulator of ribonuclease activity A
MPLQQQYMPSYDLVSLPHLNVLQGIVVDGPIRDSQAMSSMQLGVKALGTCPLKSDKAAADQGQQQVPVQVQGVSVSPGDWVYADWDGILVSKKQLE